MSPHDRSDLPDTGELVEGVLFYPIALVISATVCPGLTLCIAGLILVAFMLLIPIVAIGAVVVVAAAVVAAPVLMVRGIRELGRRLSAPTISQPRIVPAIDRRRSSLV